MSARTTTATSVIAGCDDPAPQLVPSDIIVQREGDGKFHLGLCDDAPGPFESRKHAADVAAQEGRALDVDTA
jgi:hypothetical protein